MHNAIEFERSELAAALATAGKVKPWCREYMREVRRTNSAGDPETVKVRDHRTGLIKIDVREGLAFITSGNFDLTITVAIDVLGPDAVMYLPLTSFAASVEKAPAGAMIALEPNGADTVFRAGRFRSKMSGTVEDFAPIRPNLDEDAQTVPAAMLKAGLALTAPATLDDAKRPFLGGVYLHDGPSGFSLAAMDETRLHASSSHETRLHASAILPEKLADLLATVLPDQGDVQIVFGARTVEIHTHRLAIASPIIDGQFPEYEQKLCIAPTGVLTGRADRILSDFDLVATVADPKTRDVRLDLGENSEVSAFRRLGRGFDSGAVELEARYTGKPLAIGFQMRIVSDALAMFGDDQVEWQLQGPMDASVITSLARPGVAAMVSPIRLLGEHQREAA